VTLTFDCPFCGRELRFREYVWTHVHPTTWGRRIYALGDNGWAKLFPQDKQEQQAHQQQVAAQQTQVQETFKKAYGACLEGKGYSVK